MTTQNRKSILVVDDHPITRYGLVELIRNEPDLSVSGEAESAGRGMLLAQTSTPDLVLADITMEGKSGLEFIKDLHAIRPNIQILVLSMHDESIYAERVLRAGGRGYVMKSEGGAKVLAAIRKVLAGDVYVSSAISSSIMGGVTGRRAGQSNSGMSQLTDREFEVFQLLGGGLTTSEIARQLNISSKTVDTHRLNIKEKLQLKSLPQLLKYAIKWGAMQPSTPIISATHA